MNLPKDKKTLMIIGAAAVGLALLTYLKRKKTAAGSGAEETSTYTTKPGEVPAVGETLSSLNTELAQGIQTLRQEQQREREGFEGKLNSSERAAIEANTAAKRAEKEARVARKRDELVLGRAIHGHDSRGGNHHKTKTRRTRRPA
jgi:hypothetical protein